MTAPIRLSEEAAGTLASAAASAPSMHNAQPWRFRYVRGESAFEVHADPERGLPHADPDGRALHLGCGAALLNLRAASAAAGLRVIVRILPEPDDAGLLAVVWFDEDGHIEADLARLAPAVDQRRTSREPFAERRLPQTVRDSLIDAAAREGVLLTFPAAWHLQWVLELAHEASAENRTDVLGREELAHWTRVGGSSGATATATMTDGIPDYAFGPRKRGGRAPVRDFGGGLPAAGQGVGHYEEHPQLALLSTHGDRISDWVRAGQAMERVLLTATQQGVATAFATEALEREETRWPLRDPLAAAGAVQMILRLGYGPAGPATPRRPVADVLDIAA
ncbi:Acg family FMN-binding oxidoreductase [Streptomyces sp. TR06-5]|uniref:Acg family FMN-binding oxidoreductase n=1 Tax=unclassified Streptomyces TaxID=2593676 RepID=UPI0039A01523